MQKALNQAALFSSGCISTLFKSQDSEMRAALILWHGDELICNFLIEKMREEEVSTLGTDCHIITFQLQYTGGDPGVEIGCLLSGYIISALDKNHLITAQYFKRARYYLLKIISWNRLFT